MPASTCSDVLEKSSRADHQYAPQHFVAGAGDHPKPDLACSRMIFWRKPYPGGKISTRSKQPRIWGLHHQKRCADGPDTRNFGQALAAFIGAMQRDQFFLDGFRFGEQVVILNAMHGKKLAGQCRQGLISRNPLQQRFDSAHTLGRSDAELQGKPAYGIGELRSIANESLANRPASMPPAGPQSSPARTAW